MSVCEAMLASAACCGVGICADEDADVDPGCGEAGGVGYADDTKEGAGLWCLPLRREDNDGAVVVAARMDGEDEK